MHKSRHLITRLRFNHAKTSIWMDTLPKVMQICFPELYAWTIANNTWGNTDYYLTLPNGSEIWVAGLDDKIRTEKVLGKEYSTIFFNECSQIPYASVQIALTRLAEKNPLKKRALYDENPPAKNHWSYSVFILGKDPSSWENIDRTKYDCMLMNPADNIENIDEDYITEILDHLSPDERRRFRDGEFTDGTIGAIYYSFGVESNVETIKYKQQPIWVGMDFNVNPMTSVFCYVENDIIYVYDELYLKNSNTPKAAKEIVKRYGKDNIRIVPDHTGDNRSTKTPNTDFTILREVFGHANVIKRRNPYRVDRYNNLNRLFDQGRIIIDEKCKYLIKDLEQLTYKEGTNKPDESDKSLGHITDALGYICWYLYPHKKNNISTGYILE